MNSKSNKTARSTTVDSTGYKNPPKSGQYKGGQSGNPHRGKAKLKSLKEMFEKASSRPVTVIDATGKTRKTSAGEALIERGLFDAMKGKPGPFKEAVKLFALYLPAYEEPPTEPAGGGYTSLELTQEQVDDWRRQGFLPRDCPYAVEDIDEADLTRAARASAAARRAAANDQEVD